MVSDLRLVAIHGTEGVESVSVVSADGKLSDVRLQLLVNARGGRPALLAGLPLDRTWSLHKKFGTGNAAANEYVIGRVQEDRIASDADLVAAVVDRIAADERARTEWARADPIDWLRLQYPSATVGAPEPEHWQPAAVNINGQHRLDLR